LIVFNPVIVNSAEILQIKSSNTIRVGDQNRNLTIRLFCVDVNENDELEATNLLKSEFPRGSKVKIKPFGSKENVLLAKVFNIKGTREMTELLVSKDLDLIINLTLKINDILKSFFEKIQLQLVDFKLEFGYDLQKNIILGDEISPDNCRLWDLNQKNDTIVSLDKDRFRNDLGGLIEAYSEINRRINDFI